MIHYDGKGVRFVPAVFCCKIDMATSVPAAVGHNTTWVSDCSLLPCMFASSEQKVRFKAALKKYVILFSWEPAL